MKREILDIRWSNVHAIGADVKVAVRTEVKGTEKIRTKSGIGRERQTKECIENIKAKGRVKVSRHASNSTAEVVFYLFPFAAAVSGRR